MEIEEVLVIQGNSNQLFVVVFIVAIGYIVCTALIKRYHVQRKRKLKELKEIILAMER